MSPSELGTHARPRVVIVGAGFGGREVARILGGCEADVLVIDRTNHHLFQPLLYQVATATLAATDITTPVRWLVRHNRNVEVLLAEVTGIDPVERLVRTDHGREYPYDYLVVATGARHSYFGHIGWEPFAPGLKSIDDALEIRRRFLLAFETAERLEEAGEQERWLTFVIVGGGPTGVELAGMIPTVARLGIRDQFRRIDTARTRVVLLEAGERVLPTFPPDLAEQAAADLRELGVDIRVRSAVTNVDQDGVCVGNERIFANTVFWAAGNQASPLGRMLGAPLDRSGRVKVEADLSVAGHPEVFVLGDLAALETDGKPVPAVAPAAMQSGRLAGRNVLHSIRREPRDSFRYHNKGDLATIGRYKAIAAFGNVHVSGRPAWLLWLFVHILYLAGFRNRLSVLLEWSYAFFTYQLGARLISAASTSSQAPSTGTRRAL